MNIKKFVWEYFLVTVGTAGVAAAAYFFMFPCNLGIGSVSGVAMFVNSLTGFRISVVSLIINVLLMIIGVILIGKDFGAKTVYSTVMMSVVLYIYETVFPLKESLTKDALSDMICYCIVVALSQALLFHINASSGGLDIIAKILNKFMGMELGTGMVVAGMAAVLPCFFMYDTRTGIISILGTYISGVVLDYYLAGFNKKKRVCILSKKKEEIASFIINDLDRGVTFYETVGGYSGNKMIETLAILNRDEYIQLMAFVEKVDPGAFITVSSVNEVIGEWSSSRKRKRAKIK